MLDEEIEADEEFWNQDAFKEVRFSHLFEVSTRSTLASVISSSENVGLECVDVLFLLHVLQECICCISLAEIWLPLCVGWQDVADDEYEEEQELADEFDSDFNDDVFHCILWPL